MKHEASLEWLNRYRNDIYHTYDGSGMLISTTYTGGYKTLYAYSSGNLSTVEYTDTDGTTVLLTETMGYTSGNLTSVTRS